MLNNLPAHITISRTQSTEGDYITIRIVDARAHVVACEVEMSPADFALALTGLGHVACLMDFNVSGLVGKAREYKTEVVIVPGGSWEDRVEIARGALRPLEVDGWIGRTGDALNHHNRAGNATAAGWPYRVGFERWVDAANSQEDTHG